VVREAVALADGRQVASADDQYRVLPI
jgi:hypothetical protein